MNKGKLVNEIVDKTELTKKQTDAILTTLTEVIMDVVSSGEKVSLMGFGSFEVGDRKAREGSNPNTGEKMTIPASKKPVFYAGKTFKGKVKA